MNVTAWTGASPLRLTGAARDDARMPSARTAALAPSGTRRARRLAALPVLAPACGEHAPAPVVVPSDVHLAAARPARPAAAAAPPAGGSAAVDRLRGGAHGGPVLPASSTRASSRAPESCARTAALWSRRALARRRPLPLPLRPRLRGARRAHAGAQGARARARRARLSAAGRPRRPVLHPGEGRQRRGGMADHSRLHQPVTLLKGVSMNRRRLGAHRGGRRGCGRVRGRGAGGRGRRGRGGSRRRPADRRTSRRAQPPSPPPTRRPRSPAGSSPAARWPAPRRRSPPARRCAGAAPGARSSPRPAGSRCSTPGRAARARWWSPRGPSRLLTWRSPNGSHGRRGQRRRPHRSRSPAAATAGSSRPTPTPTSSRRPAWRPRERRAPWCAARRAARRARGAPRWPFPAQPRPTGHPGSAATPTSSLRPAGGAGLRRHLRAVVQPDLRQLRGRRLRQLRLAVRPRRRHAAVPRRDDQRLVVRQGGHVLSVGRHVQPELDQRAPGRSATGTRAAPTGRRRRAC